jgi:hypothetical protein
MIRRDRKWPALLSCLLATPALAQVTTQPVAAPAPAKQVLPDPATIEMPRLDFTPTAEDASNYDKYFYFHRDGTSFAEAYEDVKECDALASGISYYSGGAIDYAMAQYQYGFVTGAIAGAIGDAMADAIYGSAGRRRIRRVNMRNCMGFKGYQRYGLSKDLWEVFNFEEGNGRKESGVRKEALVKQALVASGQKPQQTVLPR